MAGGGLADLGALALLAWWIRLKGWPRERLLIYAASPLPVLEFWSSGHHDAWIVLLIAAALVAHAKQSSGGMMTALGLAALTKYWPLMLVPLFAAREGRRWRWAAVIPALALAAFAPYGITALETNARFATGFVGGWRNNDFLFGALLAATGDLYQAKYLAFAIVAVTLLALWWRNGEVEPNALLAVAALLVVSANIHPWYGTWLLPFLIAAPRPPILVWIALFPVFYETVIEYQRTGIWEGVRPSRWLVHGTFAILVLIFAVLPSTLTLKKRHN